MHYDVFNGDADGIIALLQLRLAEPKESTLVTGVKRDIQLLEKLSLQAGDTVTALDISMEKNKDGLNAALDAGAHVFYADHHKAGQIPESALLDAHIDLDANVCTALIIDRLLGGQYHLWAIAAAYGDNLISRADELADKINLTSEQKAQLKELGTLINYNGYGAQLDDLHFSPATLFTELLAYDDPFAVIADQASPYHVLKRAYQEDMAQALSIKAKYQSPLLGVFELPDEPYSRRVSGVYGNLLANQSPDSAHVVLTANAGGAYTVSLRAPLNNKQGAGDICSQFATGGGRAAAAGINTLERADLNRLIEEIERYYG